MKEVVPHKQSQAQKICLQILEEKFVQYYDQFHAEYVIWFLESFKHPKGKPIFGLRDQQAKRDRAICDQCYLEYCERYDRKVRWGTISMWTWESFDRPLFARIAELINEKEKNS